MDCMVYIKHCQVFVLLYVCVLETEMKKSFWGPWRPQRLTQMRVNQDQIQEHPPKLTLRI